MTRTVGIFLLLLLLAVPARGQDFGDLSGSVDVSKVDAKVDGEKEDTLRQLYTINYFKTLTSYINFRAGFRYYDFDLDRADAFGSFQEEVQPSGELMWRHPWFDFTATASRRISRSTAISGKLINDSVLLDWRTAWMDTPTLGLTYELQNVEETGADALRNVENQRLTGWGEYEREREYFYYSLARFWNENVISGVSSVEYAQRLNYRGDHDLNESRTVQLATQYRYSRVDRTSEVTTGQRLLERVDPAQGLGGFDQTPDQGPLPLVPGLIDGNTIAPVAPPISIGAGDIDRNIGVDFGFRRDRVAAIYIYVDQLSSATVQWSVWISDDNLVWDGSTVPAPVSRFVPALSRYEIEFPETSARFIKVVNGGVNNIPNVLVTEIEVFEAAPSTGEVEYDASSHLADARMSWQINRKWSAALDAVARYEPATGSVSEYNALDYSMRARYQQSPRIAHVARAGQSWQNFENTSRDTREDQAGYVFLYDPIPTIGTSASASVRQSFEGGDRSLSSANALLSGNASPWPALQVGAEVGATMVDQPIVGYETDAWHTRLSMDADFTRQLRGTVSWTHQETWQESRGGEDDRYRVRRTLTLGGELRITSAIFGRANVYLADDETFRRSERYLLSWRLFTRLLLTGQADIDEGSSGYGADRYSVSGTLDLFERLFGFRNVTVYVRFSDVDLREASGSRILSWQQGVRATF